MKTKVIAGIVMTLILVGVIFNVVQIGAQEPIKIAVVGPQGWPQWDGMWVAAKMAQEKINGEGGILGHQVELIPVNSHAVPEPDPAAGWLELFSALEDGADFVVGGFRTECVAPMRDEFVSYAKDKEQSTGNAPIWFIAGASTDNLIDCGYSPYPGHPLACGACVRCDYDTYKYMFRVTPQNSTWLFKQFAMFLRTYVLPIKLAKIYGTYTGTTIPVTPEHPFEEPVYNPPVKTYVVCEDLSWNVVMGAALTGSSYVPEIMPGVPNPYPTPPDPTSVLGPNCEIVGYARTDAATPAFEPVFTDIDDTGAHLIIHIISAGTGPQFIKTWYERETKALCVGINVLDQQQEIWQMLEGKCHYETFLATVGTRTPIVEGVTEVIWDEYLEKSGDILTEWYGVPTPGTYPIYTFWGAYDAVIAIDETIETYGSWPIPASELIPAIEETDRIALNGRFRYTEYHDVFSEIDALSPTWVSGSVRALVTQWQAGRMETVWPIDQPYSKRLAIPPWMYELTTDLNFDGTVNIMDISTGAVAFGTKPGDLRWQLEADINGDGKINIIDIAAIAKDFGKSVSLPLP